VASWQAIRASRAEEDKSKELTEKVKENRRANKNLRLALDSLEKIYGDLAEGELSNVPHLETLREDYLKRLQEFFKEFARANRDDPKAQLEAARAYARLGSIQDLLGQKAEAEETSSRQFLPWKPCRIPVRRKSSWSWPGGGTDTAACCNTALGSGRRSDTSARP
jgi:hypothetical protein